MLFSKNRSDYDSRQWKVFHGIWVTRIYGKNVDQEVGMKDELAISLYNEYLRLMNTCHTCSTVFCHLLFALAIHIQISSHSRQRPFKKIHRLPSCYSKACHFEGEDHLIFSHPIIGKME